MQRDQRVSQGQDKVRIRRVCARYSRAVGDTDNELVQSESVEQSLLHRHAINKPPNDTTRCSHKPNVKKGELERVSWKPCRCA